MEQLEYKKGYEELELNTDIVVKRHNKRFESEKHEVEKNRKEMIRLRELDRGRQKDKNFTSNEFYSSQYILSFFPKYQIFVIPGSRGRGKTYSGKNIVLNRFLSKRKGKFAWLRLTDEPIDKILQNDGATFFESSLLRNKSVDVKTVNNDIYFSRAGKDQWEHRGKAMSIQKYGSWKGNQFEDYDLIIMDELVRARSEKKTFNIPSAFVNMLENIARERKDIMVIIYANTLDEMSEIRDLFGFMPFPGQHGIYKLPHKKTIIEYLDDSKEWKQRKRNTIAGRLAEGLGEFTNTYETMLDATRTWLQPRNKTKKKYLFPLLIAKNYVVHLHRMDGGYIYVDYVTYTKDKRAVTDKIYSIRSKLMGPGLVYNKEIVKYIKEIHDLAKFRFSDLKLLNDWHRYLEAYGIIT